MPTSLETAIQPEQFSTKDLGNQVMSLHIAPDRNTPSEPRSKRRKVSDESRSLPQVTSRIYDILRMEPKADLAGLGDALWCVLLPSRGCLVLTVLATAFLSFMSANNAK